jgi:hypothetical protein
VFVFLEKPDKQKSAYAFVAVSEGVIFDDEVEEMRCLLLDSWVEVGAIKCRDNG